MKNTLETLTPLRVSETPYGGRRKLLAPDGRTVAYVPADLVDVVMAALERDAALQYTYEEMLGEFDVGYVEGYLESREGLAPPERLRDRIKA